MRVLEKLVPPPVIAILCGLLMWWSDKRLPAFHFTLAFQPWFSMVLVGLGGVIGLLGVKLFFHHEATVKPHTPLKTKHLVTSGVYHFSRNPMYLGLFIWLLAWGLYVGTFVTIVWLLAFVVYINRFQILPEEEVLYQMFGDEYEEYKQTVRRWI